MKKTSFAAEWFFSTLKNKIYQHITLISKNVYIDKLDDIVNKYNNTYHSTIKTKPVDVKWSKYIDTSKESNDKDPKFKIGDIVLTSKCQSMFASICSKLVWRSSYDQKVKNTVPQTYAISVLMAKKLLERFMEKAINYLLNRKTTIVLLTAGLIKKTV